jgi:hypothetical protein
MGGMDRGALSSAGVDVVVHAVRDALHRASPSPACWRFSRLIDGSDGEATRSASPWTLGLLTGIAGGLAALTRPAHLLFLILAGSWLLWKRGLSLAVVVAIGAAAVIGPWTLRNYRAYGRLVLIASEGGITFWTGKPSAVAG